MKTAREKCAMLRAGIPLSAYDHTLVFQNGEFLFSARTKFAMDPRNAHVLEAEIAARSMVAERQS